MISVSAGRWRMQRLGSSWLGWRGGDRPSPFGVDFIPDPCGDLFHVVKPQCIMTWVLFGLALLWLVRKLGIISSDEDDEEEDKNDATSNVR